MPIDHLSVETLNNGKLLGEINAAIRKALENCADPQMPLKGKRKITVTLAMEPMLGSRERPIIQPAITTKLVEAGQPAQFVTVNVVKRTAHIENVEQGDLFTQKEQRESCPVNYQLETLQDGHVLAEINLALQRAVENIADPDTPCKGKRTVVAVLTFENADESDRRDQVECQPLVFTKLQPRAIAPIALNVASAVSLADVAPLYDESKPHTEETYV